MFRLCALVLSVVTVLCFASFGKLLKAEDVNSFTTEAAAKMIAENKSSGDFVLLDVRTPAEFKEGHLENATQLDFHAGDFATQLSKLDKKKTFLVYCRSGNRSGKAVNMMKTSGFAKVYDMLGGITKWKSENRPVISK